MVLFMTIDFSSDFEFVNFVRRSSIHVITLLGVTEIKYTTEIYVQRKSTLSNLRLKLLFVL